MSQFLLSIYRRILRELLVAKNGQSDIKVALKNFTKNDRRDMKKVKNNKWYLALFGLLCTAKRQISDNV